MLAVELILHFTPELHADYVWCVDSSPAFSWSSSFKLFVKRWCLFIDCMLIFIIMVIISLSYELEGVFGEVFNMISFTVCSEFLKVLHVVVCCVSVRQLICLLTLCRVLAYCRQVFQSFCWWWWHSSRERILRCRSMSVILFSSPSVLGSPHQNSASD